MNNIQLTTHLRNGEFYDLTDMVPYVRINGSTGSGMRTLETELLNPVTDKNIRQIQMQTGSSVCFYVNGKEIYRGNIVDLEKSTGNGRTSLIAKDLGFSLTSKMSKNFVNVKPEDIAKKLIEEMKLPVGTFAKTNINVTRYFRNVSVYEIIMTLYTLASKKTKKQYELEINLDKISVAERGKVLNFEFTDDTNISDASHFEDIENVVNTVFVYDKEGNKKSENVNKDLKKIYNRMMSEVLEIDENTKATKENINALYHGEDHKCRLTGYGDYTCKTGGKVHVEDKKTGLIGEFYIDSDTHEWSGGNYRIQLDLNFKNIMDAKEAGSETLEKKNSQGSYGTTTKDWGHGIKAEQLNKVLKGKLAGKGDLIIKYCNMYKVNPAIITAIMCNESGYGTSNLARNNNNFFGMRTKKDGWLKFKSIEEGIRRGIANISKNYIHKGLNTFGKMVDKYAESGGAWIPTNESIVRKITGKSSSQLNFGTGVKTDAEAKKNVVITGNVVNGNVSWNGEKFINEKQKIIVQSALSKVGKRYIWGAKGPNSFDCSGLAFWAHKQAGITIGGASGSQLSSGGGVNPKNMMPGDIIICKSRGSGSGRHVKIYIGNGMVVEAASPSQGVIKSKVNFGDGLLSIRRCW